MKNSLQIIRCDDLNLKKLGFSIGSRVQIISRNESGVLFLVNGKTIALDYDTLKKIKFRLKPIKEKSKEKPPIKVFF